MIPDYVSIDELVRDADGDNVAIGQLGEDYPGLEQALSDVTQNAVAQGFGSLKIVVLDRTPAQPADLRDIATEVQQHTGVDTVIVRSPGTGAVVSETYARKAIEQAEKTMYGDPDYVVSAQTFVDSVQADTTPWQEINLGLGLIVLAAVVTTGWATWRRGRTQSATPADAMAE
ncbi:hypothetical protein C1Y63_03230 [Corynebacterium sp. 13CS0277]|uniref:Rv1476 family membrane protein n=1 Tax=Corynebacterium sp. 13CS0277 TaxID=2071994 RepID=UPI000D029BA8|nr:DUF6676 family protein [Corynebacterium sp. 13CS0277]PRQ12093.1 hypothetical protein C1Y63_03230 [Corynebacterium sp. 13CS0277]